MERDEKSIDISYHDIISVELLTRILGANDIIVNAKIGALMVNERYRVKVNKFLSQGLLFSELSRAITQLKLHLLAGENQG